MSELTVNNEQPVTSLQDDKFDFFKSVFPPKTAEEAKRKEYTFWKTQPVPKLNQNVIQKEGSMEKNKVVSNTPESLPNVYMWKELDVHNNLDDLADVHKFLNRCNVEDPNSTFIEEFTEERLKYMLGPSKFTLGVVSKDKSVLAGFISGRIQRTQIKQNQLDILEVTSICIHPKIRRKKLATKLITELKRRANLDSCYQGIFSTERYIPVPFTSVNLHHRPLNVTSLVDAGFTKLTGKVQLNELENKYQLPNKTNNKTVTMLTEDNLEYVEAACDVLNKYLSRYTIHPIFTKEEFIKRFVGDNSPMSSYVIFDDNNPKEVIDFFSYSTYNLNTRNKDKVDNFERKTIKVGRLYYYTSNITTAYRIVKDCLITAKKNNVDLFNITDIMENNTLLRELDFDPGPVKLHYNFYNWKTLDISLPQVGFNFL